MEKNPTFAKACVANGHEIAAHGYRWLELWDLTLEEDEENIIKACKTLEKVTGEFPVGVYFGRGTPNTKALFADVYKKMGKELLYNSEAYNDDVPYWIDLPSEKDLPDSEKKGMCIVPYNYDCNDGKFHMNPGFGGTAEYEKHLKMTFDALYREGCNGRPKMMNVPMHSRILGKPARTEALRNFLLYVKSHDGVWVATRRDIAKHFREKFPYQPGHLAPGHKVGL
jgi:peptidoglycan/xylan/chitin deacetylase (PgdA/CDA1 family)